MAILFLDHNGDRVGFIDFVHHDDAREAKNAKGHLVSLLKDTLITTVIKGYE